MRLAKQVPRNVRYSWGPLAINWQAKEAVEVVNRVFKLRDCKSSIAMYFADQQDLFALDRRAECVRGETGSCLGPCAGQCSRTQYIAQLRAARAFLDGRDASPLAQLEEELKTSAAVKQFERAAATRDKLVRLQYLCDRLAVLRERPLPEQFIYPALVGRRPFWYAIAATRVVAAMPVPADSDEAVKCLERLNATYDSRRLEQLNTDRLATQILAGWLRSRPAELQSTLTPGEAVEICRRLGA